jgi:hypothetical protein
MSMLPFQFLPRSSSPEVPVRFSPHESLSWSSICLALGDNTLPKGYGPSKPPMCPPGYAPMAQYHSGSGSVPCTPSPHMRRPSGPIETQQGTEISPDLFSPFYLEGPQTQARSAGAILSATAVAAGTSANTGGNGNGRDDYAQLLAVLATQQPTRRWGASGGEMYMLEENDVGGSRT